MRKSDTALAGGKILQIFEMADERFTVFSTKMLLLRLLLIPRHDPLYFSYMTFQYNLVNL